MLSCLVGKLTQSAQQPLILSRKGAPVHWDSVKGDVKNLQWCSFVLT